MAEKQRKDRGTDIQLDISNYTCEILKDRLYFSPLRNPNAFLRSPRATSALYFSVENDLVYEPFSSDFGPLNMASLYRFCTKLNQLLQEGKELRKPVHFYCSSTAQQKSNAAVLIGGFCVLFLSLRPDEAYRLLSKLEPFLPFRDASKGICTFKLSVQDCIRSVHKGKELGWINFVSFDVDEYERLDDSDVTWMVPGRLVAFSTPVSDTTQNVGCLAPEDYLEYFNKAGLVAIIRLNKKVYDKRRFTNHGFAFHDLYFSDGGNPPDVILKQFFDIVEGCDGPLAIHCKAGLGRTGVLIGLYMMKQYHFSAHEAIGYMRMVRPGSVIGKQQQFLLKMQPRMWKAGEEEREKSRINGQTNSGQLQKGMSADEDDMMSILEEDPVSLVTPEPHAWSSAKSSIPRRNGSKIHVESDSAAAAAVAEMQFAEEEMPRRRQRVNRKPGTVSCQATPITKAMPKERVLRRTESIQEAQPQIFSQTAGSKRVVVDQAARPDATLLPRMGGDVAHTDKPRKNLFMRFLNSIGQPRKVVVPQSGDKVPSKAQAPEFTAVHGGRFRIAVKA